MTRDVERTRFRLTPDALRGLSRLVAEAAQLIGGVRSRGEVSLGQVAEMWQIRLDVSADTIERLPPDRLAGAMANGEIKLTWYDLGPHARALSRDSITAGSFRTQYRGARGEGDALLLWASRRWRVLNADPETPSGLEYRLVATMPREPDKYVINLEWKRLAERDNRTFSKEQQQKLVEWIRSPVPVSHKPTLRDRWRPVSLQLFMQALIDPGLATFEQLAEELRVDPTLVRDMRRGIRIPGVPITKIREFLAKRHGLPSTAFDVLVRLSPSEFGLDPKLLSGDSPFMRELRMLVDRKRRFNKDGSSGAGSVWMPKSALELMKQVHADNPEAGRALRQIYYATSIHMPADDMAAGTIADFDGESWKRIIGVDPGRTEERDRSHLWWSNKFVSKHVARIFGDRWSSEGASDRIVDLNIVEGGVGGTHTTMMVLDELFRAALAAGRSLRSVRYRGFDITPEYADSADALMSRLNHGTDKDDTRAEFFRRIGANLMPLTACGAGFVEACSMETGVRGLCRYGDISGKVDLFMTSYALHHVPSTRDLLAYLTGTARAHGLPTLADDLEEQERFRSQMLKAIDGLQRREIREHVLFPMSGPAKVFVSLMHAVPSDAELQIFRSFLSEDLPRRWSFENYSASLSHLIQDRQASLLTDIHQLLRPGGVLAIADPDGTSAFNVARVPVDREMCLANFLSLSELAVLVADLGFASILTSVIERKDVRDPRRICTEVIGAPDFLARRPRRVDEPNLGYILVARKPMIPMHPLYV